MSERTCLNIKMIQYSYIQLLKKLELIRSNIHARTEQNWLKAKPVRTKLHDIHIFEQNKDRSFAKTKTNPSMK